MHRWLAIVHLWFLKALEYRAELMTWAGMTVFNTVILLFLWISLFRGQPDLLGFSVNQIIHYYLLATIINGITASHFEAWRSREVREGRIDHLMTKPVPYPLQVLLADIGNRLTYITIIIPITLVIYAMYFYFYQLQWPAFHILIFLQFVGLLAFGYLVEFSFAFIAVLVTFWFESGEGLEHFKWLAISLFSGYLIPLEFMPVWLRQTVEILPFKYIYSAPIRVLQQQEVLSLYDYGYILLFLGFLFLIQRWLWSQAVKKYTSAGG